MVAKDNKYSKVEGLLYNYKGLPLKRKCIEINLKLNPDDEEKCKELERIELTISIVESMLEMVRIDSEIDYLILKLKYIDRLSWVQIESQLHMSISWLIKKRREIIIDKLIAVI